ncbi:MAG: COX15/CtaA family protein [Labilithrix sp.]|nr:COX15/CtaA family protein [Labilithrix sp.]MBX3223836.1 COX15/CtaA family protein [Labilithrix sp.]
MPRDRSKATTPHTDAEVDLRRRRKIVRLAWAVLGYNVAVVLWGAFVRATGSGAGCGRHWPLCNGEVIPQPKSIATIIEATHRATSGVAVVAVLVLLLATFVGLPRGHRARRGAVYSTVFIFGEALVGAGLVLFELVAHDASMKRALSMILHLSNTFLLLGALALTAWWATTEEGPPARDGAKASDGAPKPLLLRGALGLALGSVLVLGASGAVAALGDTLFPASSLREGLAQDLSPMAHAFLRLRLLHPVIALGSGVVVLGAAGIVRSVSTSPRARGFARLVTILYVVQFAVGLLNLSLLAPVVMQLVHLLLADATWIALVLMSWEAWTARDRVPAAAASEPAVVS